MSTNAVIRVEGFEVAELYKHWDGDPDNTLEWLKTFNKDFVTYRGEDPPYKFAQLIRSSAVDAKKFGLDENRYTGWGVNTITSTYFEYLYILRTDGGITICTP